MRDLQIELIRNQCLFIEVHKKEKIWQDSWFFGGFLFLLLGIGPDSSIIIVKQNELVITAKIQVQSSWSV